MTAYSRNLAATKVTLRRAVKEQGRENDSVFLIGGQEGIGKSTFLLHCIDIVDNLKGTETQINSICRTLKELIVQIRYCNDEEQIALDEGSELASDNQYMAAVKGIKRGFTIFRAKKLIVYICFTNPLKVNTYFREDRIKGAFFITKRGVVYFYTRSQLQSIMEKVKKFKSSIRSIATITSLEQPLFIDTFPDYKGRLLSDYKKRKRENINDVIDELYQDFGVDEKLYSLREAAKFIDINKDLLRGFLKESDTDNNPEHILPFQYNLSKTKIRIKEKDLLQFRLWYQANKAKNATNPPHVVNKGQEKNGGEGESQEGKPHD